MATPAQVPELKPKRTRIPAVPKTVRVGAHEYKILRKKNGQIKDKDGNEAHGTSDDSINVIELETPIPPTKGQEIVLHELTHTCFYAVPGIDEDTEEKVVTLIAPRLLQILQDNPDLVRYLCYKKPLTVSK